MLPDTSPPLPEVLLLLYGHPMHTRAGPLGSTRRRQWQPRYDTIDVCHAWQLALMWHKSLANKVSLVKTGDKRDSVGRGYGWIRFGISLANREEVSAARATALTWFALSCCPGYGGHENPVFWKHVLNELRERDRASRWSAQYPVSHSTITDAVPFFDSDAGIDFPRFCVSMQPYHENVRLFCGLPGEKLEADDEFKLQLIMDGLQLRIDPARTSRRPEVLVAELQESHFDAARSKVHAEFTRFLEDATATPTTTLTWRSPSFTVKDVTFTGTLITSDTKFVNKFLGTIQKFDLVMTDLSCIETPVRSLQRRDGLLSMLTGKQHTSRQALATVVRHVLGLPGVGTRTRVTRVKLHSLGLSCVPAFLSALPFATTTEAVDIHPSPQDRFEEHYMVWLAYALFHPDTPSSTWRSLALVGLAFNDRSVQVLQAMANGNNLTAFGNDQRPISDGYYQATLVQGATVLDRPVLKAMDTFLAAVLATSDGTMAVDVCGVASTDPHEWGDWVQVVVPAYGLAWVSSMNVTSVEKRAPSPVSLTRLRLDDYSVGDRASSAFPSVLRLIGHRLVHLDLGRGTHGFDLPAPLQEALASFSSLESLVVCDDGGLLNGELLLPLRDIVIHLEASRRYDGLETVVLPRSLERLQINARVSSYQHNTAGIQHILTQCHDHLRVFHWSEGSRDLRRPKCYSTLRAESANRLAELGLPPQEVRLRLPTPCAAAFLSVLNHHDGWGDMDQEVAKIIVAFAGESVDRVIVLEQEEEPRRGRRGYHVYDEELPRHLRRVD